MCVDRVVDFRTQTLYGQIEFSSYSGVALWSSGNYKKFPDNRAPYYNNKLYLVQGLVNPWTKILLAYGLT